MQKNSYPSSGNLDFESRLFQALESIKEKIPQEEISYLAKKARVILLDFCDVQKRYYLEFLPEGKCNIGNKILDLSPMIHVTITTKTWESMANQSLNPMSAFLEKKISIVGLPLLESRVFMPFAWKFLAAYQENFSLPEKSRSIKAPIPSSPKGFFKNLLRFPVTLVLLCIPALRFLKLRKWTLSLENWMEDTWYLWDKEMRRNLAFGRRKESYSNTSKWNKDQRLVVLSNTQEIKIEKEEPKSPPFVLLAEEEISEEPAQSSKEKAPEPANTQQKTPENKNPESIPLQVGDEKKTDSLKARASQKIGEELPIAEPQINIDRSTPEQAGKNAEEIVISKPIPEAIVNDTKISSSSSHEAIVIPQEEASMIFSGEEELSENEAIIFAHEAIEANESISSLKKEEKAVYIEFSEPLKNNAKTPKNILEEKISLEEESDWDDSQENITIIDLEKEKAIEDAPPIKKEEKDEKITIVDLEKEKNKKNHRKSWEDSEDDITVVDLEKKWQDDNLEESRRSPLQDPTIPNKFALKETLLATKEEIVSQEKTVISEIKTTAKETLLFAKEDTIPQANSAILESKPLTTKVKEDPVQPKNPVAFHYKPTVTIANLVSQGMNKQDIMDNNTIKSIMEKSFYHLENVGYRMDYTRACHALSQYGCTWDNTSNMVKFPQESIYRAIEHFQSKEKTKTPSVLLAGSCRQRLLEWEKKLTREGGIEDAKKIIQLFNFLPSVDFSSCGIYPLDVPKDAVDLVNTALLCKYSAKPFIQEIYSLDSAKLILEMLRILQGSKQEKINKMVCIMRSSSMQYKKIPLQLAELWHQEEYPIWITSSFITQNAQYYPTLCQVLCEWLAGIVYIASLGGNSPCLLHWDSCNVYNENSLFFSPEQAKIALGLQQISQTLGFPCFANLGPNLSWWDFQTGWEKGCAGVFSYIQQSSWASYAGILGEDFSPEQLVLDNFIANIIKKWQEKMQNSMETMPVEKLCEMARQRVFPGKKHEALELSGLLGDSFYKEKEDILGTIHRHIKQIFEEQNHPCLLSYDIEKEIERLVQIRYEQLGV